MPLCSKSVALVWSFKPQTFFKFWGRIVTVICTSSCFPGRDHPCSLSLGFISALAIVSDRSVYLFKTLKTTGVMMIIKPGLLLRDPVSICKVLLEQEHIILHYQHPTDHSLFSQPPFPPTGTYLQGLTACSMLPFQAQEGLSEPWWWCAFCVTEHLFIANGIFDLPHLLTALLSLL